MHKLFYLILFLLFSSPAYADGYWLELEGSGKKGGVLLIKIRYGGVTEDKARYIKSGQDLDKMKDFTLTIIDPNGTKTDISIQQKDDCWLGSYIPEIEGTYFIYAVNHRLPVVERENVKHNIKPVQYLKTTYIIGKKTEQSVEMPYLNLDIKVNGRSADISVFIDGRHAEKDTPLRIFLPNNRDIRIKTDEYGKASISLLLKGPYIIRLDKSIPKEDYFEGKKYFSERHRFDYRLIY